MYYSESGNIKYLFIFPSFRQIFCSFSEYKNIKKFNTIKKKLYFNEKKKKIYLQYKINKLNYEFYINVPIYKKLQREERET